MGQIAVNLLGPFEVCLDGEPVTTFESDKVRALLAYLASEPGQAHRREMLAGLLWPERPDRAARTNLRHVLANLRKAIKDQQADPPSLLITRQTIQFNFENRSKIDILTFTNLVGDGSAHQISQLEQAVELYRGEFLKGFSLDDSISFEEWALLKREDMSRKMVSALERLSQHYERAGDVERAIEYAQRQAALEPWQEDTHRRLMILFALSGREPAALKQYEECKRILRTELDIDPSPKTIKMFKQIRDGCFYPPVSLPIQTTPFVGREGELAALDDLFTNLGRRLVTILGPGGIGKTRLAQAFTDLIANTSALHTQYSDGVFFVDLAPLPDVARLVLTLAEAFNLRFQVGDREKRTPKQQLLDFLQKQQLLLVLDNFEHLLSPLNLSMNAIDADGADLVSEIVRTAPDVRILVTSRERLHLQIEQVFAINGLDFPVDEQAPIGAGDEVVDGYAAVKLFLQTAQRSQYNFSPETDDERLALIRICQLVEGMPLALEMAASRVDTISPVDIVVEIQQSLDFLKTKMRDVPPRQRSVRAAFDTSWQKLEDEEQSVFTQLSIFRGGFTQQAAQAVTGATSHQLSRLVNKSLIQFNQLRNRYQVHELLRQYGAEYLSLDPELETALRFRHSAHYCQLLADLTEDQKGAGQAQALAIIEVDIENIRLAWNHAIINQDLKTINSSVESLWRFYWNNGWLTQGLFEFEKALNSLRTGQPCEEKEIVIGGILAGLGWLVRETPKARQIAEQIQTLLRKLGTRVETLMPLVSLAILHRSIELHQEAEQYRQAGLALARETGNEWAIACLLQEMGHATRFMGDYERSDLYWQEALNLFKKNGDKGGEAWTLARLSVLTVDRGQYRRALALAQESWLVAQEYDFNKFIALNCLGVALHALEEYEQARVKFQLSLELLDELKLESWVPEQIYRLGKIAYQKGDYACAYQQFHESLTKSDRFGIPVLVVKIHNALSRVCIAQCHNVQAKEHLQTALKEIVRLNRPPILLAVFVTAAEYLAKESKFEYAVILATSVSNHSASQAKVKERATRLLTGLEALLPAGELTKAHQASRQTDLENLAAKILIDLERL